MYKALQDPAVATVIGRIREDCGEVYVQWISQTLDPLHAKQSESKPVCAPSHTACSALVFSDATTYEIQMPDPFPDEPWTIQFQLFADQYGTEQIEMNRDQNVLVDRLGAIPLQHGGVRAYAQTGSNPNIQWSDAAATQVMADVLGGIKTQGKSRTTALSMKVTNTTPPLFLGGSAMGARHNEAYQQEETSYVYAQTGSTTNFGIITVKEQFSYPSNTAELANLPGYKEYEAKEGAMCVAIVDPDWQTSVPDYTHSLYESLVGAAEPNTNSVMGPYMRASTAHANKWVPRYRNCHSGVQPMQVWFTGVDPAATFRVSINRITEVELASNVPGQQDLISLTTPGTKWCAKAVEVMIQLQRAAQSIGHASENDFGTWLKNVFKTAIPALGNVLSYIPHPLAQGVGLAARSLGGMMQTNQTAPMQTMIKPKPKKVKRTIMVAPPQGAGPFAGITYGNGQYSKSAATNFSQQPTNLTKTLKNRRKRERKKLKRNMEITMSQPTRGGTYPQALNPFRRNTR